jgi:hypothetical protein
MSQEIRALRSGVVPGLVAGVVVGTIVVISGVLRVLRETL